QVLDRLLAGLQRRDLLLQGLDLGDLDIQLGDAGLDVGVSCRLGLDLLVDDEAARERESRAGDHRDRDGRDDVLLAALAPHLAMRQQVAPDHASNLRVASPQLTSIAGASSRICFSRTPPAISMPWKGLRISVG